MLCRQRIDRPGHSGEHAQSLDPYMSEVPDRLLFGCEQDMVYGLAHRMHRNREIILEP